MEQNDLPAIATAVVNRDAIAAILRARVPGAMAVYAFGSRITGASTAASDLDLAVLVEGYADAAQLWDTSAALAETAGCTVDLLDFRAASTVLQHQILTTGERWWARDGQAGLYEAAVLNEKTELDTARAGLIADIRQRGSVYGR